MVRFVMMILTTLMLNVVPLAASAHGIGMAAPQSGTMQPGMTHSDRMQPAPHTLDSNDPGPMGNPAHPAPDAGAAMPTVMPGCCDMRGDSSVGTALCDWLCTGVVAATAPHDTTARRQLAGAPDAPAPRFLAGMSPAPHDRPPNARLM